MLLILVKENLGHASLNTTSLYLHAGKDQRHRAMGQLYRGKPGKGRVIGYVFL